ncbi:hypothetical protein Clacol_005104 [Clathrus columnatus]|uniref:alpha-D-xyloside xylohydrolase n=1 Tax=Clathrus columnatus TaxID=1419009 RepID=A0AAV5A8B9_9AGAM|nr:hypothetical protein Clacol_005104 [Clathrus columnatus]
MRFTNGTWDVKEGIKINSAVEVSKLTVLEAQQSGVGGLDSKSKALRALCTTRHVRHRGDTLNKPTITVEVASPGASGCKDVLELRAYHFRGKPVSKEPRFERFPDFNGSVPSELIPEDSLHTGRSNEPLFMTTSNVDPLYRPTLGPSGHIQGYMAISFSIAPGETIYGLGERFGPFVKNGQVVDIWHEDGGTDSPIGYGVFVDSSDIISFEVQSERMDKVQISLPDEQIRVLIINGPHPKRILELYTAITGRPPIPAPWTFGLWLTTSFLTSYDEDTVTNFLDGLDQRNIPLTVFHFDCFWMKAHQWCDFEFDKDYFPDAASFIQRLHKRGLKICVWINSYIGQESPLFLEGDEKGYFIKKLDGSTWQSDRWQAGIAIVDFTNPAATRWYQSYLAKLIDMGVDAFKTDFGERIPWDNVKFHDGSHPRLAHNYYTHLYNQAVFDIMVEKRGIEQACVFARSATVGGQRYPVHWGGDCSTLWTGMAEALRGSMSLGLAGFGFSATDIGGFKAPGDRFVSPDPALYKRWVQWGLLASHSRLHGSTTYRVPWEIEPDSPESSLVLKAAVELKHRLMPYIMSAAQEAHETGVPLLRALFIEFPEDPCSWKVDLQYMFGSNLLVAPIFNPEGEVTYYVPKGRWVGLLDKIERVGPRWFTETYDFFSLPILLREGTAIVLGTQSRTPEYDLMKDGYEVITNKANEISIKIPHGRSLITVRLAQGRTWAIDSRGGMKAGMLTTL